MTILGEPRSSHNTMGLFGCAGGCGPLLELISTMAHGTITRFAVPAPTSFTTAHPTGTSTVYGSVPFEITRQEQPIHGLTISHRSNSAGPERVDTVKDVLTQLIVDHSMACPWSLVRMHPICSRQSQYRGSRSSPRRNKVFAASVRGTTAGDERYDYSSCPAARKVLTKDPQRLVSIP